MKFDDANPSLYGLKYKRHLTYKEKKYMQQNSLLLFAQNPNYSSVTREWERKLVIVARIPITNCKGSQWSCIRKIDFFTYHTIWFIKSLIKRIEKKKLGNIVKKSNQVDKITELDIYLADWDWVQVQGKPFRFYRFQYFFKVNVVCRKRKKKTINFFPFVNSLRIFMNQHYSFLRFKHWFCFFGKQN